MAKLIPARNMKTTITNSTFQDPNQATLEEWFEKPPVARVPKECNAASYMPIEASEKYSRRAWITVKPT